MQNSIQFSYIYIALTQCALYCKVRTQPSGIYLAATLSNSGTKELLFNMKIPSTTKLIRDRLWDEGKEKREKKESIETQGQNTNCGRKDCISWRLLAEGSHFQCIMGHLPAA